MVDRIKSFWGLLVDSFLGFFGVSWAILRDVFNAIRERYRKKDEEEE